MTEEADYSRLQQLMLPRLNTITGHEKQIRKHRPWRNPRYENKVPDKGFHRM